MRILFFSSVYPHPDNPTRGIYCRNFLSALDSSHDWRVVAPWAWISRLRRRTRGAAAHALLEAGVVTHPIYWYPPGVLQNSHGWFMWLSSRSAIRRSLLGFRPECVLSYWTHPDGEAALRTARSLGIPIALIVGGSDVLLLNQLPAHRRRRFVSVLRGVDQVLTVSQDLRSRVIQLGVDPERVGVNYRGIDSSTFAPGDQTAARIRLGVDPEISRVLWVGRMVPVKALDVLVESARVLRNRGLRFHLDLVGDGPLRRKLEVQVSMIGMSEHVTFAGARPQSELADWYLASDVVALPSLSEGVPNVLREGLASGRPFVASRVGGIPEIADQETCRLVAPGDAEAFADALGAILERPPSPELILARNPLPSWEQSAQSLVQWLEAMVERKTCATTSREVPRRR